MIVVSLTIPLLLLSCTEAMELIHNGRIASIPSSSSASSSSSSSSSQPVAVPMTSSSFYFTKHDFMPLHVILESSSSSSSSSSLLKLFLRRLSYMLILVAFRTYSITTGSYFMMNLSRWFNALARFAKCGYRCSNWHNHFHANRLRPVRVFIQTSSKLRAEQKFWVMPTVCVKLSTACHQPLGTKTVSPGFWVNS